MSAEPPPSANSGAVAAAPFGVSGYTTHGLSLEDDIQLCKDLGIRFLEVCEAKLNAQSPDRLLEKIKEAGLTVSSVQPRLHSLFPDFPRPEPKAPADRMKSMRETARLFGKHFPGTTLVTISGAAPNGHFAEAYRTAAKEYKELARVADDCGVRIALEPLNPVLMNTDTFICSLDHASRIISEVDHPRFGLLADVWHFWEDSSAPGKLVQAGSKIFGVHISDWKTPRAFGDRLIPGQGDIPLVPLLKAVRQAGYGGAYTLEIFSELTLPDSLWADPRLTIADGKRAFETLWRQVCA